MNEKITLSGVPETMLQTLYARAKETCTRGAIRDEKAAALVERIDYDFSLADKDAAMHSGVIARTIVLDRLAEKMAWLGITPESIRHILITHQDTDHVGAVEEDSPGSPCAHWPSWRRSCAYGGYARSSSPATPAGRTVRLRLRTQGSALLAV